VQSSTPWVRNVEFLAIEKVKVCYFRPHACGICWTLLVLMCSLNENRILTSDNSF